MEQRVCPIIEKMPTGIQGFDEITAGGLPRNRTTLLLGGPGSGKTVFALQVLADGARHRGEPGIFVAFEEDARRIVANAATFGWDVADLEKESLLFFLDARLSVSVVKTGEFDVSQLLAAVAAKAREMGAKRVVFDGIDILLSLLDNRVLEQQEIHRLSEWLSSTELTAVITGKLVGGDSCAAAENQLLQFIADCFIQLDHTFTEHLSLRSIKVVKYRGTKFQENEFPLVIGPRGIEVVAQDSQSSSAEASSERVSSGVARLDTMLTGGYYRGSSILISGAPGTAKSTLAGAFLDACCRRGERALFVSFDEPAPQIVRNLASVEVFLAPHVERGLLRMYSTRAEARSGEKHYVILRSLIEDQHPTCLVIDPLSALLKAGGSRVAAGIAVRLLDLARARGITVVCTSLSDGPEGTDETTRAEIASVADTWIHLSYVVKEGERNRGLTIVKSRGMRHSNQVRELSLSDDGITLKDVFIAGGEVLMGTARWEKENAERLAAARARAEVEQERRALELAELQAAAQIEAIRRELEAHRAELAMLEAVGDGEEQERRRAREELRRLRDADGAERETLTPHGIQER